MTNIEFQRHKLHRAIEVQGIEYTFFREELDEFKEPTGASYELITVKGIWHESQGYVTTTKAESSVVRSKTSPQILVLYQEQFPLKQGDFVMVGDTRYTVTGYNDPTNLGIAFDISLEAVV